MALADITIGATNYPASSYSSLADAETYLGASIWATAWLASTDNDAKGRALITATRWLDEATWSTTYATQALRDGVAVVVQACQELAALLVDDPTLRDTMAAPLAKRVKADVVEIENFRPSSVTVDTFFPARIMTILQDYLDVANPFTTGSLSYGTDTATTFDDDFGSVLP